MKIINNTYWRTDHLRAIAMRIAKEELETEKRKVAVITFNPARQQRSCSGHAQIGGRYAWVNVPTRSDPSGWIVDLAKVTAHEMAHLHGKSGERWMRRSTKYGRRGNSQYREFYAWANDMPLERKPTNKKKPKPTGAEHSEKRLSDIDALLELWETKKRRAETYLKKYRKQRRYYEKRLIAQQPADPT